MSEEKEDFVTETMSDTAEDKHKSSRRSQLWRSRQKTKAKRRQLLKCMALKENNSPTEIIVETEVENPAEPSCKILKKTPQPSTSQPQPSSSKETTPQPLQPIQPNTTLCNRIKPAQLNKPPPTLEQLTEEVRRLREIVADEKTSVVEDKDVDEDEDVDVEEEEEEEEDEH
ncbi:hematopoietic lineage cell-specific protein-like, partial [Pseudomyrmex gracilis]|uniref:hematopoietic lineage cell-specific protein-like n=1 Tax=Pseudomyrmex gracilis TaxID=219809 RepID=UPI000995A9E6